MSIYDWAERECRIACNRENPDFDFDSTDFDYGCSCYKSALKAYKSLCDDEHSGFSWNATKNILIKLMDSQPLTSIEDSDFFKNGDESKVSLWTEKSLAEKGLKSYIQCPRMHSLFREERLDGTLSYRDIDRAYHVNIEFPSDTYRSSNEIIDEMFPITMPYFPSRKKYKIYEQSFLVDEKHGDFDVRGIIYIETPDGKKIHVGRYSKETNGGKWVEIDEGEYIRLLMNRIDDVSKKVADRLMFTLISNSGTESDIERKEAAYKNRDTNLKMDEMFELCYLCKFFDNPNHYKYNTFDIHKALCEGRSEVYGDVPELVEIAGCLSHIKESLSNENSNI